MAAPDAEKKGNSLEEIQKAVNEHLASCSDSKYIISVTLKEKEEEEVAAPVTTEEQGPKETNGGKRNKRKTRSKRSARKSHKSRRVFGGKRK